jgi:hypothetical protein
MDAIANDAKAAIRQRVSSWLLFIEGPQISRVPTF